MTTVPTRARNALDAEAPPAIGSALVRAGARVDATPTPVPRPAGEDLLLAMEWAGVCGTDLQILSGMRAEPAAILGHEGVARIVAAGPGADPRWRPGRRVTVNPTHPARPDLLLGHAIDGLMQSHFLAPGDLAREDLLVPVEDSLPGPLAALIEPLATVLQAIEICPVDGRDVLVHGGGIIGHLLALEATRSNAATRVTLVHGSGDSYRESPLPGSGRIRHRLRGDRPAGPEGGRHGCGFVATDRAATVTATDAIVPAVVDGGGIHLVSGLARPEASCWFPDLDLGELRASNCAGTPEPAVRHRVRPVGMDGESRMLSGHRGVANRHMVRAAALLDAHRDLYAPVVTHRLDPAAAAAALTRFAATGDRSIGGRRFLKIAIDMGSPYRQSP